MRKLFAALAITVASLAVFEGCAPVPLPYYAAYKPRRVEELLVEFGKPAAGGRRMGAVLDARPAVAHDSLPNSRRHRTMIRVTLA